MALNEYTFSVTVIVINQGRTYTRHRTDIKQGGCNHIANIPGTANYMGQEILEEIRGNEK